MIKQLTFNLKLTIAEYRILISNRPWNERWNDPIFTTIKQKIKDQLSANQNCCAYCGLPFKGPKDKQIEHIAPKANFRQPQFTFTLHNLVLSCGYCNDLIVKGTKPTISLPVHRSYKKCNFLIVHPYFDNPADFYGWTDKGDKILIQVKNNESKASYSIEMFSLDSEEMSGWRAAYSILKNLKKTKPLNSGDEVLMKETLDFKD